MLYSGSLLWSNPDVLQQAWNVFAPGVVSDIDGDGVEDLVVINGGDPKYKAQVGCGMAASVCVFGLT